jgi:branched-subunit amino acid transport protein
MITWIVVRAVAAGTLVIRASLFVGLTGRRLPIAVQSWLTLAGPAAIATLVVSALVSGHGGATAPEAVAGLAAFLTVRRTGNVNHAFVVGMPTVWVFSVFGLT